MRHGERTARCGQSTSRSAKAAAHGGRRHRRRRRGGLATAACSRTGERPTTPARPPPTRPVTTPRRTTSRTRVIPSAPPSATSTSRGWGSTRRRSSRTFDYGEPTTMPDGTVVREWDIVAVDKEIEIAPGVFFPAWTYNGQVPGPTLRCNEGERLRITLRQQRLPPAHDALPRHPHAPAMDGVTGIGRGEIEPGATFTYEFAARPFGCHLYHCHATPLKRHIHKGLYGAFIVNPDPKRRGDARQAAPPRLPGVGGVAGVRDGDERLRHQLRRRERGLRGQHRRLPLHEAPDPGRARPGRSASIWST